MRPVFHLNRQCQQEERFTTVGKEARPRLSEEARTRTRNGDSVYCTIARSLILVGAAEC
jgi:hypothetical protein